jgi:LysM repeat protein
MLLKKHVIILLSLLLPLSLLSAQKNPENENRQETDVAQQLTPVAPLADSIINYSKLFLHTPYRYGSAGDSSFDCSGFTSYVYRNFGYLLPHNSAQQAKQSVPVKREELQPGDLVFFSSRRSGKKNIGHVGIVVKAYDNNNFDFIHAATGEGVTISSSEEPYYSRRFVKAGRVVDSSTLLCPNDKIYSLQQPNLSSSSSPQNETIIPAKYHRVKSGETLSSIAKKYGISVTELKQINRLKGNVIHPHQNLKIKEAVIQQNSLALANNSAVIDAENETATTYTVKHGETLSSVAKKLGISVEELKEWNQLNGNNLRIGQKLIIDKSQTTASAPKKENQIIHRVVSGESLHSIARKYGCKMENIKVWNHKSNNDIKAGEKLILYPQNI